MPADAIADDDFEASQAAGEKLASIVLDPDPTEYMVQVPAAPQDGLLKFRFSTTRSPEEANASEDKLLAAAFQRIAFEPADDERSPH